MKFLAVFVTLAAVAFGYPESTTWTLNELSAAIQNPETDPILLPLLEGALNEMIHALHQGENLSAITIAMPIVADYNVHQLAEALQNPNTHPAHIPYLEDALNQLMDAFYAGIEKPTITVVIPADLPMPDTPVAEPGFIDVWPIQAPEAEEVSPVAPEAPIVPEAPAAPASSSPLVQIIVNVKQQQAVDVVAPAIIADQPSPVEVIEGPLAGWGNFI